MIKNDDYKQAKASAPTHGRIDAFAEALGFHYENGQYTRKTTSRERMSVRAKQVRRGKIAPLEDGKRHNKSFPHFSPALYQGLGELIANQRKDITPETHLCGIPLKNAKNRVNLWQLRQYPNRHFRIYREQGLIYVERTA